MLILQTYGGQKKSMRSLDLRGICGSQCDKIRPTFTLYTLPSVYDGRKTELNDWIS